MNTARDVLEAATVLAPVIHDVANWLAGEGGHDAVPPPVLAQLPAELRSEVALRRAKARAGLGSRPPAGS